MHYRVVSKVITNDEELKGLEQHIAVKGGRITGTKPAKDGTRVYYSVPATNINEEDEE